MNNIDELLKNSQIWFAEQEKKSCNTVSGFSEMIFPTISRVFPSLVVNDIIGVQPIMSYGVIPIDFKYDRQDYVIFTKAHERGTIDSTWNEIVRSFTKSDDFMVRPGASSVYSLKYISK